MDDFHVDDYWQLMVASGIGLFAWLVNLVKSMVGSHAQHIEDRVRRSEITIGKMDTRITTLEASSVTQQGLREIFDDFSSELNTSLVRVHQRIDSLHGTMASEEYVSRREVVTGKLTPIKLKEWEKGDAS
jgi:hypothetical protein